MDTEWREGQCKTRVVIRKMKDHKEGENVKEKTKEKRSKKGIEGKEVRRGKKMKKSDKERRENKRKNWESLNRIYIERRGT